MRHIALLSLVAIIVLASACDQQSRGHRRLTTADSLRRARAIAEESYLNSMEQVHDDLSAPAEAAGTGAVVKGYRAVMLNPTDTLAQIVRTHDRYHKRLSQALIDSTTPLGALLTRVLVQDSMHSYLTGTYTFDGHLLTFHYEITPDERQRYEYELCFDHGRLLHIRERNSFGVSTDDDEQEQDAYTDDMYYLSGGQVVYSIREEGSVVHHMDHTEFIPRDKYVLQGDIPGHVWRLYQRFQTDYDRLEHEQMEVIVYTAAPHHDVHTEM